MATPPSPVCRPGEPTREDAAVSRPEDTQGFDGEFAIMKTALREPAGYARGGERGSEGIVTRISAGAAST
jgi:hypothetical protein